jgi:hypothetical protein
VVDRCEGDFRSDLVTEILEPGTIKILGIIDGDLLWNSIETYDVLLEEFLDGGRGYIGYRLRFNPFGEIFYYDDSESVVSLCWCKFTHDIDAPSLQGPRWGNQLQRLHGNLAAMREFLTSFAC